MYNVQLKILYQWIRYIVRRMYIVQCLLHCNCTNFIWIWNWTKSWNCTCIHCKLDSNTICTNCNYNYTMYCSLTISSLRTHCTICTTLMSTQNDIVQIVQIKFFTNATLILIYGTMYSVQCTKKFQSLYIVPIVNLLHCCYNVL